LTQDAKELQIALFEVFMLFGVLYAIEKATHSQTNPHHFFSITNCSLIIFQIFPIDWIAIP